MSETTMNLKKRGAEKMAERPTYAPPVDIFENKDEVLILADMPGVTADALTVNLDRDQLTIDDAAAKVTLGHRRGRLRLPARLRGGARGRASDKIAASLQNGVLRVTLAQAGRRSSRGRSRSRRWLVPRRRRRGSWAQLRARFIDDLPPLAELPAERSLVA